MTGLTRRTFLRGLAGAGLGALGGSALWADWRWAAETADAGSAPALPQNSREARYYTSLEGNLDCASCHSLAEPSPTLYCHLPESLPRSHPELRFHELQAPTNGAVKGAR